MNTNLEDLKGYRGASLSLLKEFGVKVWSEIEAQTTRGNFKGILLPRSETSDDAHIVIKLSNGYNVGLRVDSIQTLKELSYQKASYKIPEKEFPYDPKKPNVTLLGTGGTIASRLDYRTGAVIPAFSPGELFGAVPELADICNLNTIKLYGVFSENIGPEHWIGMANAIYEQIKAGVDGIIIGHGTDTMHYSSSALCFMIQNLPIPVVMVGSQRSSDRPSSDAAYNLMNASTAAAYGDIAETTICMFGPTSDQYDLLHRGTRVRKMHSSYRSTFRTIGDRPLARVSSQGIVYLTDDYIHRDKTRQPLLKAHFEEKVSIVYYYPNMKPDIIDSLIDNGYRGIIIAGTGLGHVNKPLYPSIKKAIEKGIHIFMSVETLWGYVQMYVYDTGRDIMKLGVVPAGNMIPETAYIKLGWVLAQTDDREKVRELMLTPVNHEITKREPIDGYLIFQGGLPEIENSMKQYFR